MRIRLLLTALFLSLVSACDTLVDDTSPLGQLTGSFGPQEYHPRFIALLRAKAPALQLGVIDKDTSGVLLRESNRNGVETWLSPDGAAIILDHGMLVGTRGLGGGLLASDISQPLSMVQRGQAGWSDRFHTFLNGEDQAVTRTYRCKIEREGAREVTLARGKVSALLMKESCRSLDQSFFNLYWVDQRRGKIVQSRQWAGEFVGPVSTRVVEN